MRCLAILILLSAPGWAQTCTPPSLIRPVDSVTGTLDGACQLSDGTLVAKYRLLAPTLGRLQLNISSDDFQAAAILRDSSGRRIGAGSSVDQTIERGEYTLLVNAQNPGHSGKFVVTSVFQPEPNTICRIVGRVGLNQLIDGRLADSSCRLPDNTPHDGYLLHTLGSGTLEITLDSTDFSGQLILRGDDGRALVTDPKTIALTVLDDSNYTIVAAGGNADARGSYKLATKFTPADDETCRPKKTLLTPEDVTGGVTGDSCPSGTDLRFEYYNLTVTDAGLVDLRVTPNTEVPTRIDITDANGQLVAEDIQSGGLNRPLLRQQLLPGAYTVLVTSSGPVDYALQFRFNPGLPATCPVLDLRNGTQSGSFDGASSCRSINVLEDRYRFTLGTPNTLDIVIGSNVLSGYLVLADAKDNVLVQNSGEIVADLKAGTYSLSVQSVSPGAYAINAAFKGQNLTCPNPPKLTVNNSFNVALGAGVCRGVDGQPLDVFEFTTSSAGQVGIIMASQAVDSYLTLTDTQGTVLRRDDDSFGYPDAMILQWLPAGTYRINASASGGLQSGQYALYLLFAAGDRSAGCLPVGDLNPGTIQRTFNVTACQYIDDSFADIFRLQIPAATSLDITMTLARSDVSLELLDQKGNLVDLVGNGGTSAKLATQVDAGTYYEVAKSYGGLLSAYTLAVK